MNKLNISAIVCTLNNSKTIRKCLKLIEKNNPREIIVVDGHSEDQTVQIAKKEGARVILSQRGVARQRQLGIDNAKGDYICFIDADDFLEPDCLMILLKELKLNNYDAIQAMTLSHDAKAYWQKGMHYNMKYFVSVPGPSNMLGRPALYRKEVFDIVKFDPIFTYNGEDSDFSIRMEQNNLSQGIGTGISHRYHSNLSSFKQCFKKWMWYGQGDGLLAFKHKGKLKNIVYHLLINYPVKKSYKMLKNKKGKYVPFFVLHGLIRFAGFFIEYLRLSSLSLIGVNVQLGKQM